MTTYLITGGAGFIGSHLSQELLKLGNNVVSIDNFNSYYSVVQKENNYKEIVKTAKEEKKSFTMYRGNIQDANLVDKVFKENDIDAVISLAANAGVRPSIEDPISYVDANLIGLVNILEKMKDNNCLNLVFASSSSVYGNNSSVPFKETDKVDSPISPYAATKRAGELLCYTYHHLFKINVACLRYFTVYGPRQRPDLAINKFTRLIKSEKEISMFGDGSTARDYTFITDIVDGTIKALNYISTEPNIYEIFNLGGSNPIKLLDLITLISEKLKKDAIIKQQPMQQGDVNITYSDYSHAKMILGYEPKIGINKGIEEFVNWYIENEESFK